MVRKEPQLPDNQRQNLDIINRGSEHLLTLINDVLEMAKIEAGRVQLENTPFDLKLQKILSNLAENFDYPAILKALQIN